MNLFQAIRFLMDFKIQDLTKQFENLSKGRLNILVYPIVVLLQQIITYLF